MRVPNKIQEFEVTELHDDSLDTDDSFNHEKIKDLDSSTRQTFFKIQNKEDKIN